MYTYKVKFDIISAKSLAKVQSKILLFDVCSSEELNKKVEEYILEKSTAPYICEINDIELVHFK